MHRVAHLSEMVITLSFVVHRRGNGSNRVWPRQRVGRCVATEREEMGLSASSCHQRKTSEPSAHGRFVVREFLGPGALVALTCCLIPRKEGNGLGSWELPSQSYSDLDL